MAVEYRQNKTITDYISDALIWCDNNKEILIVGLPLILGGITKWGRISSSHRRTSEIKRHRDLDIYDRSLGMYYTMRRKPTAKEYGEITARKRAGEGYYEILTDMGLL